MTRILEAAGAAFAEKGVDGTTMTEIAGRSGTAIGSLYRFFPTKEGIVVTLLERFIHDRLAVLDQICDRASPANRPRIACDLLEAWLEKREERDYTTLLLAARPDAEQVMAQWRAQFLARVVTILEKLAPASRASAAVRGEILLHVLKLAPQLVKGDESELMQMEMQRVVLGLVNAG